MLDRLGELLPPPKERGGKAGKSPGSGERVVAGFLEGLEVEVARCMDVVVVRARECEADEDACALAAGRQLGGETLEHRPRASAVPRLEVVVAGVSGSAPGVLGTIGRRQAGGLLGELGCHAGGAARGSSARRLLERGGNGGIRPGRGEGEVARPLLGIDDDLRQAAVELAPALGAAVCG
jgi:hypothetical protein